jgi:hypothetical protein
MFDRLILSAVLGTVGLNGLFPDPPPSPTPLSLQQKARNKSVSAVCNRKKNQKQSKTVKEMCNRWEEQQNA